MENLNIQKNRHWCLTAWLYTFIILNAIYALGILFFVSTYDSLDEFLPAGTSRNFMVLIGVLTCIIYIYNMIMILKWKKWGFWGFILTIIVVLVITRILGEDIGNPILYFISVIILYGLLQLKKDGISGWRNLE